MADSDGASAGATSGAESRDDADPVTSDPAVGVALALDALVVAVVTLAGVAVRALSLYWSPLPATLDGFVYTAQVERILATGGFPTPVGWDALGWAGLLGVASAVSGVPPLYLAQPLTAALGGATCLAGAAVARGIARDLGWAPGRARMASALAGRGRSRLAWGALAAPLVVVLPPTHGLTSLVAALSVTAVAALHLPRGLRTGALAVGAAAATWGAVGVYYVYATVTPALALTYVDRLLAAPGLFLAWTVLLAVGTAWYVRTGSGRQRGLLGGGFGLLFGLLALVVALVVPAALAAWAAPAVLDRRPGTGWVALAAVAGPLAMVGYSLSAGLTFDYYSTAIRTQTFLHVGVCVLAALAVAGVGARTRIRAHTHTGGQTGDGDSSVRRERALRAGLEPVLVAATVASAPLIEWAGGGPPPSCPTVATRAWTTTGFHRFPAPPVTVPTARYEQWVAANDRVYSARGVERVLVVRPAEARTGGTGCEPDPGMPDGP